MESLLLGQFPKPSGLSRGSRNCGKDFSKDCLPAQGLWFRSWSIYEGYRMKCRLTNVPERNRFHGGRHKKLNVNAASGQPLESDPDSYDSNNILNSDKSAVDAFYRFSRPHTVIGTALSIVSVSLLAVEKITDFSPIFFTGVFEAVVAALFMNIYIVGLNQLSDIDIDKVNKPYLPLASGEYSVETGALIVSTFSILSFIVSWIVGSWPLFWALFLSFVLGTAYSINVETVNGVDVILSDRAHFYELCSKTITFKTLESGLFVLPLPIRLVFEITTKMDWISFYSGSFQRLVAQSEQEFPRHRLKIFWRWFLFLQLPILRWKRFAVVAAMCILTVRAVIVQLAFFLHIQTHVFQRPAVFSRPLIFATAFMSFFSVVIALFKDIPDIEGDKTFGIRSFTVRLGQKRVFWICITLLEMAYVVAILFGSFSSNLWCKATTVIGHLVLASLLWVRAGSLDFGSKAAITSFYMFIWQLFYAEYLLIPLVR